MRNGPKREQGFAPIKLLVDEKLCTWIHIALFGEGVEVVLHNEKVKAF